MAVEYEYWRRPVFCYISPTPLIHPLRHTDLLQQSTIKQQQGQAQEHVDVKKVTGSNNSIFGNISLWNCGLKVLVFVTMLLVKVSFQHHNSIFKVFLEFNCNIRWRRLLWLLWLQILLLSASLTPSKNTYQAILGPTYPANLFLSYLTLILHLGPPWNT